MEKIIVQKFHEIEEKEHVKIFENGNGESKKIFLCITSVTGRSVDSGERVSTADVIFRTGGGGTSG